MPYRPECVNSSSGLYHSALRRRLAKRQVNSLELAKHKVDSLKLAKHQVNNLTELTPIPSRTHMYYISTDSKRISSHHLL